MEKDTVDTAKTIMNTHKRGPIALKREVYVPSSSDPRTELRKLVREHKALVKSGVAITNMTKDKVARQDFLDDQGNVIRKKGDAMPCLLPSDVQKQYEMMVKEVTNRAADKLKANMLKNLRKIPIYTLFLEKVFGLGEIVSSYLIAEIDIHRSIKPSALRRFCGFAVIDGGLERPAPGAKNRYSKELRTRIYQAFSAMWKNGIGKGKTSKYLKIWADAKHRKMQMAVAGKVDNGRGKKCSAAGYAHSYGWHKAADILIEDLYVVWRAIEGLPVWPSYYAAKLGYEHGGKISVNAPKSLTVDEALELVGDVSGQVYTWSEAERKGVAVDVEEVDAAAEE
jgi:hypothetical protein